MHLLQGESDCGQHCISPRLQLIAIPATLHFSALNHHHLQRRTLNIQELLHSVQPSICRARGAAEVTQGQSFLLQKYPSNVQTCKSHMCPLICREWSLIRNAKSHLLCRKKVWKCTQVKIQDLHSSSEFHLNPVWSQRKRQLAAIKYKLKEIEWFFWKIFLLAFLRQNWTRRRTTLVPAC